MCKLDILILCFSVIVALSCNRLDAADPTEGERVWASLSEEMRQYFHNTIRQRDYVPASGVTQPASTEPAATQEGFIEFDVDGFCVRVPRNVKSLEAGAPRSAMPLEVDAVSASGTTVWTLPRSRPLTWVQTGSPGIGGKTIPLHLTTNDLDPSPVPGMPNIETLKDSLRLPADAQRIVFQSKPPLAGIPHKMRVELPDWTLTIDLNPPNPFVKGMFDQWKGELAIWPESDMRDKDVRRFLVEPLTKAGEPEEAIRDVVEKTRKEFLNLSDEELFAQVLTADKDDLRRQTTLQGTVRAAMLQFLAAGEIVERFGVDRCKVNNQTVYIRGLKPVSRAKDQVASLCNVVAFDKTGRFAWWGFVNANQPHAETRPSDPVPPGSPVFPSGLGGPPGPPPKAAPPLATVPVAKVVRELYQMLDAPGQSNLNPFIRARIE